MTIGFALPADGKSRAIKSLDELAEIWTGSDVRVWVDLESPSEEDLQRLDQIIKLDDESLEDCLHGDQRPRVDEFDEYIFLVLYGLYGLKQEEDIDPHKIAAFCGSRFLITVHREPLLSIRQVRSRCGRHPEALLDEGVDNVLFAIIDNIVDSYLLVADRYEDRLELLEDRSFDSEADEDLMEEATDVRRDLLELRRLAVAQRQLLLPVAKGEFDFVSQTLSQQFSHVCDHLRQVVEVVDGLRESVVSIRENYHAALTRRTNDIMKMLTLYAGILLPLTLIAGIYGMNFPHSLWPPEDHPASFWAVVGTMGVIAGGLFFLFRRRKWL